MSGFSLALIAFACMVVFFLFLSLSMHNIISKIAHTLQRACVCERESDKGRKSNTKKQL